MNNGAIIVGFVIDKTKFMKKTYIFKTQSKDNEIILRGAFGKKIMANLSNEDKVINIMSGAVITTIVTKIETIEELNELVLQNN